MVSSLCVWIISVIVLLALIGKGDSLKCYDCTSLLDKRCGVSFDFSGTDGDKHIVDCVGQTVACRKIETTDTYKAQTVVIRSCWNSSGTEHLDDDFLKCNKMASIGEACYCNEAGEKPCNDGPKLNAFMALAMSALTVILALLA